MSQIVRVELRFPLTCRCTLPCTGFTWLTKRLAIWTKLQNVHENIWRNIYLYPVGNDCCLFSVSHLKRNQVFFLNVLFVKYWVLLVHLKSTNRKARYWVCFFVCFALLYVFSFSILQSSHSCQNIAVASATNKQTLLRWTEKTRYSIISLWVFWGISLQNLFTVKHSTEISCFCFQYGKKE